ncbi:MAG: hypothetical protein ABID54_08170 [Pseudomonadota bacterium]
MRPTYFELVQLNPLLQKRSPEDVKALMDAIEECGYRWSPIEKTFYNDQISRGIRTQGLDAFTPVKFKEYHNKIYQEYLANPKQYTLHACGMSIWSRWVPRLIILFIIDLVLGWLILPIKYWVGSLAFIIMLFFFMKSFFVDATRPQ